MIFVGNIGGLIRGAENGSVRFDCLTRNAAQQVDAKLQSFAVNVIGQWFESRPVGRGWKAIGRRRGGRTDPFRAARFCDN